MEEDQEQKGGSDGATVSVTAAKKRDRVTLDVGGRLFRTTRTTLCKDGNSVLHAMFATKARIPATPDEDGVYFMDCDPDAFAHILNYLRHGAVGDAGLRDVIVRATADYLGLESLVAMCDEAREHREAQDHTEPPVKVGRVVTDKDAINGLVQELYSLSDKIAQGGPSAAWLQRRYDTAHRLLYGA